MTTVVAGTASATHQREWFNTPFDTQPRSFGKVRGRVRFVTETAASLDSSRLLRSADRGPLDAGQDVATEISNAHVSSRLRVTARPQLQLVVEWQPRDDPYVCANSSFPTFSGDAWSMRTDGGGDVSDGFCGAIEVTPDDLDAVGPDLGLPEVLLLLDRQFDPGYTGTRSVDASSRIEIEVCTLLAEAFEVPVSDQCDLRLDVATAVPVTTVGHALDAQLCTRTDGPSSPCADVDGSQRSLTFSEPSQAFTTRAPCPGAPAHLDVRLTDAAFDARVEAVDIDLAVDLGVRLRRDGDEVDLLALPVASPVALLAAPVPLHVGFPARTLHVGELTPDDDPPSVVLDPASVAVDEGASTTLTPVASDGCSPPQRLLSEWAVDGATVTTPSLTRSYADDLPTPLHRGTLVVRDERGNAAPPVPFGITVRNVSPSVALDAPSEPFPVGSPAPFRAEVTDPGADVVSWQWDFGDGSSADRTASSAQDRADSRSHAYAQPGEHTVRVSVHDGTDQRSESASVVAFDPSHRLVGTATFTDDGSSTGVPAGSTWTVSSRVGYPRGAVRPDGRFTASFRRSTSGGSDEPARFDSSAYAWLVDDVGSSTTRLRGSGLLDGEPGWTFLAEVSRSARGPRTAHLTVALWRPGAPTGAAPDHRFSGLRSTGNLG